MPAKRVDFDVVRHLGLALPGVEEGTSWGEASLKVRGKMMMCRAIHKSAEPNSLVVRIGFADRAELLAAGPDVYYITDHYVNYPSVLVRLSRIHRDSLRDLLGMSWRFMTDGARTRGGARKRVSRGSR